MVFGYHDDMTDNIIAVQKIKKDEYVAVVSTVLLSINPMTDDNKHYFAENEVMVMEGLEKPIDSDKLIYLLQDFIRKVSDEMPVILHVEDNEDLTNVLKTALQGHAHLISAPTLRSAEDLLDDYVFSLIILDI